ALGTLNALWPRRRPWWLKLASFNQGWFANELPLHVLAGNAIGVAFFAALGALDERPGQVGLALTIASSIGLLVLAAAHRRASPATMEALRDGLGSEVPPRPERLPTSRLLLPGLAWVTPSGVERVPSVVYATVGG